MISKIIQKEKERQEELLEHLEKYPKPMLNHNIMEIRIIEHKQSLINLKEYMKETLRWSIMCTEHFQEIKSDIQELTKMIERYK